MAITKTETIERITVVLKDPADTSVIIVQSKVSWDDPDDAELPIHRENVKSVEKYQTTYDENQQPVKSEADISGEDPLVLAIASLVWAD